MICLSLDGYSLIHADRPKNIKQGGVCIYYRETFPIKTIQVNYLSKCLVCKVNYESKNLFIVTLYRSPSQTDGELLRRFKSVIDNIH